ncbi:conjugal transfer protein TraB [Candidatus Curtissbacteria bacterium]|jgi:translation initiation factor 6 (eIF-6)|nr:conjugal transfer protein TraB [Candidatus Curtissbacteria bacterium]
MEKTMSTLTSVNQAVVSAQTVANQHRVASALVLMVCGALANPAMAAAADTAFLPLFTFFSNAATGNLTRGICLLGGIIGAGTAAVNGKILLAATGAGIAIFGMLSPQIIGAFFTGAML